MVFKGEEKSTSLSGPLNQKQAPHLHNLMNGDNFVHCQDRMVHWCKKRQRISLSTIMEEQLLSDHTTGEEDTTESVVLVARNYSL